MEELFNYNISYIKEMTASTYFAYLQRLVDEGSFYRLAELHIIHKRNVANIKIEEKRAIITYNDGGIIELGLIR